MISDFSLDPAVYVDRRLALDSICDRVHNGSMTTTETVVFFSRESTEQEINDAADALILAVCPTVARLSAETVSARISGEAKELADLLDAIEGSDVDSDSVWA